MLVFLLSAIAISLSGVMAPGPITAATLAAGVRSRHAGMFIAFGHAVIEMPLILLLVAGIDAFFKFPEVKAGIGLVGGVVLILMGIQLLWSLRRCTVDSEIHMQLHPFITGVVLTGGQPIFPDLVGNGGAGTVISGRRIWRPDVARLRRGSLAL